MHAESGTASRARARKLVVDLTIMTVIGVVLAFVGPFGSFDQPLPIRLMAWLLFSYVGYAIYSPMGFFVDRASQALDLPRAPLWLLAVIIATFPMTLVVWVMTYLFEPIPIPTLNQFATRYFYVFIIGGAVTALFYTLKNRSSGHVASSSSEAKPVSPTTPSERNTSFAEPNPLLDQLPSELGGDVIALEMEDHYVRVHTQLGSHLVLMRLRDAMTYLSDTEGEQVHRSWWVARVAVDDVEREGRNIRLLLAGGLKAPVARAQVAKLKDAGWI